MYRTILVPVENSPADQTILDHIKPLAKFMGARLLLMHVAGWLGRERTFSNSILPKAKKFKNGSSLS